MITAYSGSDGTPENSFEFVRLFLINRLKQLKSIYDHSYSKFSNKWNQVNYMGYSSVFLTDKPQLGNLIFTLKIVVITVVLALVFDYLLDL
ncbi:hypothetical protein I8F94_01700 [Enterococcus gallinarum]|nr:hypothetical protein [Enterococcus gallinarum]